VKNIQEQIKSTLAKLEEDKKGTASRARYRKEKKSMLAEVREEKRIEAQQASKTLEVTEFVSANDLASLMNVSINEVLSTCMTLGMTISINQRLDAEAITVITDEFGYQVTFKDIQNETLAEEEPDSPADLATRAPIVTIMGHVDHGKTSLIAYIRNTQITEGEAGGITQHIGAYDVVTQHGKRIAVLDTPGHEAFTAMRARGAKLTDVAIIVIAADDGVRPQTKEAINHAQLASVPLVFAFNKIDKPEANPEKVKEELAHMNILVEDWGGKYQSQAIAAKTGQGIDALLEKVLFEADLLELKANPRKRAQGTVIEATLDQGRGYVTTLMVQTGTLRQGDVVLAGAYYGKVKAMLNHQGKLLTVAGPSVPVQILGLDGAPQAGDSFVVLQAEKEARAIVAQRQQILREQSFRTKKHITLEEIGRRLAVGNFKELNIILKGDVDGSVEAMADSLIKLSTPEIQVNIVQKGVGGISESDVLLAAATDAIVIGFQVRPSVNARKLAEKEDIEIRLYSVIYDAINHVKDAMQGMLAPSVEEVITGNAAVREVFKISKVGTVAGCYITQGWLKKNSQIRLIRDGIVVHTGAIKQLKQFKQEVVQVKMGVECGISLGNFKDIRNEDVIEGFEEKKVERKL
ncbi:MAG: translation initiation factor IF-2, partial [Bacteroidota bacterium]